MCGIVGAIAERNITPILIEGLKRLEYRGYDSAGLATVDVDGELRRLRAQGKVCELESRLEAAPLGGGLGIAHTRWATHGAPTERNAHPHVSNGHLALVHNGIIENHRQFRDRLIEAGYTFESDTDTEVVAHLIDHHMRAGHSLLEAVRETVAELTGAFSIGVICREEPNRLVGARKGAPMVIGIGIGEHFLASDTFALGPVTQQFVYLEEGDVAELTREGFRILDSDGNPVDRPRQRGEASGEVVERGGYRHFMLKEIHEQPVAVANTLEGRIAGGRVLDGIFGPGADEMLDRVHQVQIVACGTSYHAGLVARYWLEALGVPTAVEVASEYRYRDTVMQPGTLLVTISQSGETADTLAALAEARRRGFLASLAVCNVPDSYLVRESDFTLMTRAGREIGVASTKAFTTQLVALRLLALALGRRFGLDSGHEAQLVAELMAVPRLLERALALDDSVEALAERFADRQHALFLGRGTQYPVAMEGALKLKEISYIHAEAYPAGELKHGPLALVDGHMPVVCVLPDNDLLEKVLSNVQEVRARGGELYLFADRRARVPDDDMVHVLSMDEVPDSVAPIVFTVPLQLLAYHVAVLKGTDIDQPRNLAKSVTVE